MMDQKPNVYINVSSRRSPEWGMYISLNAAVKYAVQNGVVATLHTTVGESLICRARNRALSDFLSTQCTHLLTLDDDIGLPESAIVDLVSTGRDIVGGVYRLKDPKNAITAVRIRDPKMWAMILKGGLVSTAQYLSSGCMMITREAAIKMIEAYKEDLTYVENMSQEIRWALYQPFIYTHPNGFREYLSEDWAFCQRAIDIGIQPYVHGKVQCEHWGLVNFDFQYPSNLIEKLSQDRGSDISIEQVNEELEDRSI